MSFHEVTNDLPYRVIHRRQYKLVYNLPWLEYTHQTGDHEDLKASR